MLVIFENIAYIAEPYVFGKAIDGLREAHRVEEEVDSSISTMQFKQVADSVRLHVLDSVRIIDSIYAVAEEAMVEEEDTVPLAMDSVKKALAKHDSIRSRKRKSILKLSRQAIRD